MAVTHGLPDVVSERRAWHFDGFKPYVVFGGEPQIPPSGVTLAAFPTEAYVSDAGQRYYVNQAGAPVTLTAVDGPHWLAIHRDSTQSVAGWTRQGLTHYLTMQSATNPGNPPGGLLLAEVTVSGGNITAIRFLYDTNPLGLGWYLVTDPKFGAVPDSTADQTAAIQAAINFCPNGRVVAFPVGRYVVTSLSVKEPKKLVGLGSFPIPDQTPDQGAVLASVSNLPIIDLTTVAAAGSQVQGIRLQGSGLVADSNQHGLAIGCNAVVLDEVAVDSVGGDGILCTQMDNALWTKVQVSGAKRHGVRWNATGSVSDNRVIDLTIDTVAEDNAGAGFHALYLENGGSSFFWGLTISDVSSPNGDFIRIGPPGDNQLYGVHFENQPSGGGRVWNFLAGGDRNQIWGKTWGTAGNAEADAGADNIVSGYKNTIKGGPVYYWGNTPRLRLNDIVTGQEVQFHSLNNVGQLNWGDAERLTINATEVVLNESGAGTITRAESSSDARALEVQSGSVRVGAAGGLLTGLTINGGQVLRAMYSGSKSFEIPSIADGAEVAEFVTVTGSAMGMHATAGHSGLLGQLKVTAVAETGQVRIIFSNNSGGSLGPFSGTLSAAVLQWV